MRKLSSLLIAAGAALGISQMTGHAADFEAGGIYAPDHLTCLEMARAEGRLIIEISLLHPLVKGDKHSEAAAHVRELKAEKKSLHRERRAVECI
jgi:hypothetical protein